jgi:hypothetical protein
MYGVMRVRRWTFESAPRDGSIFVGCTPVEGVDRLVRFECEGGGTILRDARTGEELSPDRFVGWREADQASRFRSKH